jgi:drug/metabolite transporter (DMT)-like permease
LPSPPARPAPRFSQLAAFAAFDLGGNLFSIIGISLAGSSVFQIAFSFIVVCSAALSWLVLGRRTHPLQWAALACITMGLLVRTFAADSHGSSADSSAGGSAAGAADDDTTRFIGIAASLASTLCYALAYVASDAIMGASAAVVQGAAGGATEPAVELELGAMASPQQTQQHAEQQGQLDLPQPNAAAAAAPPPAAAAAGVPSAGGWFEIPPVITSTELSTFMGFVGSLITGIYILVVTIPNWDALVGDSIAARAAHAGPDPRLTGPASLYAILIALAVVANHSHYALMRDAGPVIVGIMQAVRSAGVLVGGHFIYCGV